MTWKQDVILNRVKDTNTVLRRYSAYVDCPSATTHVGTKSSGTDIVRNMRQYGPTPNERLSQDIFAVMRSTSYVNRTSSDRSNDALRMSCNDTILQDFLKHRGCLESVEVGE